MLDKAKILVVDDVPANLEVITDTLTPSGYQVMAAISGERALKRLESYVPDLILLDVQMPGIDGFETCAQIKANPQLAHIPIIFITALSNTDSITKGFSLGAIDYITKPFREPELLARVETHLRLKALTENLSHQVAVRTEALESAISTLKTSQIQLIQQEKMSALGNLVSGVAHEINNPIGFVSGNVKLLKQNFEELLEHITLYREHASAEKIDEHAKDVDLDFLLSDIPKMLTSTSVGCARIRTLSHSLRTFSREDQDTLKSFDVHDGIESTLIILGHRLKASEGRPAIELIKQYSDLPPIECFPGQLSQVFMNILANAIDALEEKTRGLSQTQLNSDPNQITIKTAVIGEQARIHIRDNGGGMPEAVKHRIFEHLYTTKDVGKGTGLGLAIAHQVMVEKHHGTIEVTSEPGQGTEFTLTLPIKRAAHQSQTPPAMSVA